MAALDLTAPPPDVVAMRGSLASALDADVPQKGENLLIASWNVRAFGDFTAKWFAEPGDSPVRDGASMLFIGTILERFDVVAIQELKRRTGALLMVLEWLNRNEPDRWQVIATDVTQGYKGNRERLGFVYDSHRVTPSGLAAELVVPPEGIELIGPDSDVFTRQFARTPYAVSFRTEAHSFLLVTLHVLFGKVAERTEELRCIAAWLRHWAEDPHIWQADVIALGDFNIDREGDARWQAFTETHLWVPTALMDHRKRTIFGGDDGGHFYDQIAWFNNPDGPSLTLPFSGRAAPFDWEQILFPDLTKFKKSWRVSDHLPLWVEFTHHSGDASRPRRLGALDRSVDVSAVQPAHA